MLTGNTLSQLIPFIIAPVLSRLFSPEDFAVYANFLALATTFGIVATGRLELAIALPKSDNEARLLSRLGLTIGVLIACISAVFLLFPSTMETFYEDKLLSEYLWMLPLAVFSYAWLGTTSNWALRNKKFTSLSVGKVAQSLINNGLAAMLGYLAWGMNGLIIGWLVSQYINIMILVIGSPGSKREEPLTWQKAKSLLIEYRDFPLINSLHAFTDVFFTQLLLFWCISAYFGHAELGLFAVMHRYVRAPIVLITSSVSQLFYVEASQAINNGMSAKPVFLRTLKTTTFFAIPFILVLALFAPAIFTIYLGKEWQMAGTYAQCILPMLFLYFLVSPVSGIPILFKKQGTAFIFSVLGYTLTIGLLLLAVMMQWSFSMALIAYGIGFTVYYCSLLVWYWWLINRSVCV